MAKKLRGHRRRKRASPRKKASAGRGQSTGATSGKRPGHRFPKLPAAAYKSRRGVMYRGTLEDFLASTISRVRITQPGWPPLLLVSVIC